MQFAGGFAYEETLDQANAIEATLHDMQLAKPMDRLVCGDVGLVKPKWRCVPLLLQSKTTNKLPVWFQPRYWHNNTMNHLKIRFADTAVRIEVLSRFGSNKTHLKID